MASHEMRDMLSAADSQASGFYTGNYTHLIDSKGRISFPSEWRKIMPGEQERYLITILWPERCVGVYPSGEWERIRDRMRRERELGDSPGLRERHRRILEHTHMVTMDQNGRLPIKSDIREGVGLLGKVLLIGNLDHVEIWTQQGRGEYQGSKDLSVDDLFLDLSCAEESVLPRVRGEGETEK